MLAADNANPLLDDDAPWREDAACLSYPEPELFFATGEAGAGDLARAKSICAVKSARAGASERARCWASIRSARACSPASKSVATSRTID